MVSQPQCDSFAPATGQVPILPTMSNMQQTCPEFVVGRSPLKVPDASGMQQALARTDESMVGTNPQQQSAEAVVFLPSQTSTAESSAFKNASFSNKEDTR